jgi:hypothetical protein
VSAPWRSRPGSLLLAASSPLLILLGLLALLLRPGSQKLQALPALAIGCGLLISRLVRRHRRRRAVLQALRMERNPGR